MPWKGDVFNKRNQNRSKRYTNKKIIVIEDTLKKVQRIYLTSLASILLLKVKMKQKRKSNIFLITL